MTWKNYITQNHPSIDSNDLPPDNVLFIECLIETENGRASNVIHDIAHSRLGDNDIKQESDGHGGGGKYHRSCVVTLDRITWSTQINV